jgi:outer membrane lipoprotein-sorting protein
MKRPTPKLFLTLALLSLTPFGLAQRDADALLSALLDAQRGAQAMRGTVSMTVTRPGREAVFEMDLVTDGDARSLIQVVAPPRDAGQAFLRRGDELLLYNPRLRRTLRLPPSAQSDAF